MDAISRDTRINTLVMRGMGAADAAAQADREAATRGTRASDAAAIRAGADRMSLEWCSRYATRITGVLDRAGRGEDYTGIVAVVRDAYADGYFTGYGAGQADAERQS